MAVVFFVLAALIITGLIFFGANGLISSVADIHHKLVSNPLIQSINSHIFKTLQGNQTVPKINNLKGNT
jgi:hypothetical protein